MCKVKFWATWSGYCFVGTGRISSLSFKSSSYPNFLNTAQVVSRRPFSIKRAWRKRNPSRVRPRSLTPPLTLSCTTLLTPTISAGCNGALKHLTCLSLLYMSNFSNLLRENSHDKEKNKQKETWNSFNSASLRAPSMSWSHSINIRFNALIHRGFSCWFSWLKSGAVGWRTAFWA